MPIANLLTNSKFEKFHNGTTKSFWRGYTPPWVPPYDLTFQEESIWAMTSLENTDAVVEHMPRHSLWGFRCPVPQWSLTSLILGSVVGLMNGLTLIYIYIYTYIHVCIYIYMKLLFI